MAGVSMFPQWDENKQPYKSIKHCSVIDPIRKSVWRFAMKMLNVISSVILMEGNGCNYFLLEM